MSKEIQVGLIGYGFAGRTFHAPVLSSVLGLKLSKVVERQSLSSKERYPWIEIVKDVKEVYEDPSIDLVVITTPSTNHVKFIRDALMANKHVVVEKPFTVKSAEADELISLAIERGRMLSVFHNRRWDGDFLTIRELLQQKMLGQLKECEFHWSGFDPVFIPGNWRESGGPGTGVFYDLGVHFLDQALCLFGTPDTIRGDIQVQRQGAQSPDYFEVTLGYSDGLKVVLKSSRFVREPAPRYKLYGTKGSFIKYGTDPQEVALIKGGSPIDTPEWGKESKGQWGKLNSTLNNLHIEGLIETLPGAYQEYYQNIYDHLTEGAELLVKPEEARLAVRLIELALQSSEEGTIISINV